MNEQIPEKRILGSGDVLAVNSMFYTIQGEGPLVGRPAIFIRLAGCNLQCPLCDTEYTNRNPMSVASIAEAALNLLPAARQGASKLAVITGGEPFRQPIGTLVGALLCEGWDVQIETNGTLWQPGPWSHCRVTIVCSPKASAVNKQLTPCIDAWKYVGKAGDLDAADGLPVHALDHPNSRGLHRPPQGHPAPVYLQPVDEQNAQKNLANLDAVVDSCMRHGYRLCLQIHKIIEMP